MAIITINITIKHEVEVEDGTIEDLIGEVTVITTGEGIIMEVMAMEGGSTNNAVIYVDEPIFYCVLINVF